MEPSNNSSTPHIYRIEDSQATQHAVVPQQHTHIMSEVTDLPAIETTPTANSTKLVTSGGVAAALATKATPSDISTAIAGKADTASVNGALATKADKVAGATNNNFAALDSNGNLKDSGKNAGDFAAYNRMEVGESSVNVDDSQVKLRGNNSIVLEVGPVYNRKTASIDSSKIDNLARALSNPDSAPTTGSDNLVTSGGVKSALVSAVNEVAEVEYFEFGGENPIDLDTLFSDTSIIKKKVIGISNIQLHDISIKPILYSESRKFVEFANNIGDMPAEGIVIVTVYWYNSSYFVTLNGIFE